MKKHCKALELDKILARLSEKAVIDDARQRIETIEPSYEVDEVTRLVRQTSDAMALSMRFGVPRFQNLTNPELYIKRCKAGGVLSNIELLSIAAILRQARMLLDWKAQSDSDSTSLDGLFEVLAPRRQIEERIFSVILSEDEIDDSASDALFSIRRKIKNLQMRARDHLDKMIRSSSHQRYLQDAIVTIRDGRFVVPVKAEFRGEVPGLVHDTSASGATLFIEPISVVETNNEVRVLQAQEKEEIDRILAELSAMCADIADEVQADFDYAVVLNVIFAKSELALDMKATTPEISDDGCIVLKRARHPLISPDAVVPVDLTLGVEFNHLVITGPNTGGKTVTLKTIGLLTLMAMCGLLIPAADGSHISVFDRVLVDIGDEQSIEQSLSTFSAHMKNIVFILRHATERSLVLLDELGSGTDPVEGAALATAILERFREIGSRLAATTHYAELKMYALQTNGVENACCEFDVKTLMPTYRLLIGVPGRSNAFAISKRLGLSQAIIDEAEGLVSSENKRFEEVVDSLEVSRQRFEHAENELSSQNQEIRKLRQELEQQKKQLEKDAEREIQRAREQARRIVDDVRATSQQMLDELEELRKQKEREEFAARTYQAKTGVKGKLTKLYDMANPVTERKNSGYVLPRPLKKGDSVLIFDIDKKGVVLQDPDASGNVFVQAGIIKTRVPVSNLRLLEEKPVQFQGKTTRNIRSKAERSATSEVDLRGETVEEALMDLDMFIDNAVMTGIHQINIIHGKGTGALRAAVQQHLKRHPSVRTYRLGVYGEGETGVTIAELK
ncbi:MAG: endonuclease MutS2 [Oscillospiraceae bacterium]|jgi:DNA mismatch repair protein MutS2